MNAPLCHRAGQTEHGIGNFHHHALDALARCVVSGAWRGYRACCPHSRNLRLGCRKLGRPLKSTYIIGVPKSEFFECAFGPLSSHPFPLILASFPFRSCPLSYPVSPHHLPLYPPFCGLPENSDLSIPMI